MLIRRNRKTNNDNEMNVSKALDNALESLNLNREEVCVSECRHSDGCYYLSLVGEYLDYEIYVDDNSGEVLGVNSYPAPYEEREEQLIIANPCTCDGIAVAM